MDDVCVQIGFNSSGKILAYDVKYFLNAGCSRDLSVEVSQVLTAQNNNNNNNNNNDEEF